MNRVLKLCLILLLSHSMLIAKEDHRVGLKLGLTSIDNEDGWNLENGTFFIDMTYDRQMAIKARVDLGYIGINEDENGGVGSLLQLAGNWIYDIDLSQYNTPLEPYLLAGLGYEHVFDETPVFESHPFAQVGFGARYTLTDRVAMVSEFKALQMFGSSDEDNEFAFMVGIDVPLFVEVIRAPMDKQTRMNPKIVIPQAPQVIEPPQPIVLDSDNDGVIDDLDKCPHTPAGNIVDLNGCTDTNVIVIPEDVPYVENRPKTITDLIVEDPSAFEKKPKITSKTKIGNYSNYKRQNLAIQFKSNSALIKESSKASVKRFANYLKNNPNLVVTIEGYTDNSGIRSKNFTLSTKRAEAVRTLLLTYGANASKIKAVGKGDLNPIADNDTESGRKLNRRIEAVIH